MDWKLEVVVVPVSDIDRAKDFYVGRLGFRLDADTTPQQNMRVVHMTPPGGPPVRRRAAGLTAPD